MFIQWIILLVIIRFPSFSLDFETQVVGGGFFRAKFGW